MRPTPLLTILVALAAAFPLRADNSESPKPATPEESARRAWERFNTAAIIANVDGIPVTADDIRTELRPILMQLREQAKSQEELIAKIESARSEVLDAIVHRTLILRDFKEKGMQFPGSVISAEVDERILRDFNGDRAEYLKHLRRIGKTPLDDRKEIQDRIVVDYLTNQVRRTVGETSPEKINSYYEANKDGFKQPASVRLSRISLWPDATETDGEIRSRAAAIIARLDKGESFADLAKEFSKDENREQGGDSGWRAVSELSDNIARAVTGLPDGAHTPAIEFNAGGRLTLYILRRDDFRPEGARPVAEVREIIEGKLMNDAFKTAREDWIARLRDHFHVRYYN